MDLYTYSTKCFAMLPLIPPHLHTDGGGAAMHGAGLSNGGNCSVCRPSTHEQEEPGIRIMDDPL